MRFLPPAPRATARFALSTLAFGTLVAVNFAAPAEASERNYFNSVQGTWSGSGKIVAGPYKNTRFTCNLSGNAPTSPGMKLAGKCRVGLFSQPIEATIKRRGKGYRGQFLDGAKGKGLDIVSGRLRGKKLVLGIKRKKLVGTMVANLKSRNKLNITISVKVDGGLVPFIGLTLNRTGEAKKVSLVSE